MMMMMSRNLHDTDLEGRSIVVEFARGNARSKGPGEGAYRVLVEGLTNSTSWQDLKDFARKAGDSVVFTDVWRTSRGVRHICFHSLQ